MGLHIRNVDHRDESFTLFNYSIFSYPKITNATRDFLYYRQYILRQFLGAGIFHPKAAYALPPPETCLRT